MAIHTGKSFTHWTIIAICVMAMSACTTKPKPADHTNIPVEDDLIRITAVGDIMLGGTSEPVFQEFGYDYPFEKVKHLFERSNIVIGNLEGPLTNSDEPYADKKYLFKTPPELVAPALKKAGFTMMNLANNHIMDYGVTGLTDTIQALETNKLGHVGAGMNITEARTAKISHINQKRIGFLSYSLTFPKNFWASDNQAGAAFGHEHQIRDDIKQLKKSADIVIVSFHWGREKTTELREYQPLLARAAIDEGANMVIGHHPHVLQAVEKYKQGIILYSLGNFTFGSYSKTADFSMVATAAFKDQQLVSLNLTPIKVLNIDVNFQPQIANLDDANQVIEQLSRLSLQQNTSIINTMGIATLETLAETQQSAAISH